MTCLPRTRFIQLYLKKKAGTLKFQFEFYHFTHLFISKRIPAYDKDRPGADPGFLAGGGVKLEGRKPEACSAGSRGAPPKIFTSQMLLDEF